MNAQLRSATPSGAAACDDGWVGYPEVTASQRSDGDYRAFTAGKSASADRASGAVSRSASEG